MNAAGFDKPKDRGLGQSKLCGDSRDREIYRIHTARFTKSRNRLTPADANGADFVGFDRDLNTSFRFHFPICKPVPPGPG